jgi:hypothetical protein
MKRSVVPGVVICGVAIGASLVALAPETQAAPGGCLKYGLAGAVAGHYAGHHAFKGAVLGCIAGIARRKQYLNEQERLKKEQEEGHPAEPSQPEPAK